jgi:hypothetical protein
MAERYWDWLTRVAREQSAEDLRCRMPDWAGRDYRDMLMLLAPVHHLATRLAMDVPALFDEAADVAGPAAEDRVRHFGRHDHGSPGVFGFAFEESPEGPRYYNALARPQRPAD